MVTLPSSRLSIFERAEEALASTVRGFFLCRYDPLGRVFLGWQLHHYGDCHAKPNQSQCS